MTEKEFWRVTPVKLRLLTNAHQELNNPVDGPKIVNTVEELPFEI